MIISRAPFRISLFGGGSDFPAWYEHNGGKVLSFSIDKYCYLTVRKLPPFFEHKYRLAYSKIEHVADIDEIIHPAIREALRIYSPDSGLEIHHDGDLPARSGMGSSSSFAVSLLKALSELQGIEKTNIELANEAIFFEQHILKENVGSQDQIAAALGGINQINFGPSKNWNSVPLIMNDIYRKNFLQRMVLIYSGIQRTSSDINLGLISQLSTSSKQIERNMVLSQLCADLLIKEGDLDLVGEMLNENWHLKNKINPLAITDSLRDLYQIAIDNGAIGGKILGAGGGGFMLFWVKEGQKEKLIRSLHGVINVPFDFDFQGVQTIYKLT